MAEITQQEMDAIISLRCAELRELGDWQGVELLLRECAVSEVQRLDAKLRAMQTGALQ